MNNPGCKFPGKCIEDSNPLTTQEFPDGELYISRFRQFFFQTQLNKPEVEDKVVDCVSTESQEDADICAFNESVKITEPFPELATFTNTPQSCTRFCPDGLPFTYTVAGGRFISWSQAEANNIAHQFACTQALKHRICFGDIILQPCLDFGYDETITISSFFPITKIDLVSGSLPDGLDFEIKNGRLRIFGTPTVSDTFEFTFYAENSEGDFMLKVFQMVVGDSALFSWAGHFKGEVYIITPESLASGNPIDGELAFSSDPVGIEYVTSSFGPCSGTISARADANIHPDANGAWLMIGRRLPGSFGKIFNIRIRGTAKNGHFFQVRVDTSWGVSPSVDALNLTRMRHNFVGLTNINELVQYRAGAAPTFELWWGVKVKPGETDEAEINLDYTITEVP